MDKGKCHRSFTIGLTPFDTLPIDCKQRIVSNKTRSIDLPFNETSVVPSNRFSNVETLKLKHATRDADCYIVSDLSELERYINDLSILIHLQLDSTCAIAPSLFNQLLTIAPRLSRLTISSARNQLYRLIKLSYPQIRWLDIRREYLPSKILTKFCSAFPSLQHLINCQVYSEEDLEVLIENLKYLQNITVHVSTYYFDSNDEFEQWLRTHTHLKNFTFKLLNERQIQLWISNRYTNNN